MQHVECPECGVHVEEVPWRGGLFLNVTCILLYFEYSKERPDGILRCGVQDGFVNAVQDFRIAAWHLHYEYEYPREILINRQQFRLKAMP